jgi:hypothetical protein
VLCELTDCVGEDVERFRGDESAEAPVRTGVPREACRTRVEMSARRLSAATDSALVFRCCVARVDREAKQPMVATASAATPSVGTGSSRIYPLPGSEPGAC